MPVKILCASYSDEIFDFVKRNLSQFECEVIKATSVALALFLAQKNQPCLVLAELELNDGSGLDLLRELASEPQLQKIPFMFLKRVDSTTKLPEDLPADCNEKSLIYPLSEAAFLAAVVPFLKVNHRALGDETTE